MNGPESTQTEGIDFCCDEYEAVMNAGMGPDGCCYSGCKIAVRTGNSTVRTGNSTNYVQHNRNTCNITVRTGNSTNYVIVDVYQPIELLWFLFLQIFLGVVLLLIMVIDQENATGPRRAVKKIQVAMSACEQGAASARLQTRAEVGCVS